MNNFYIENINIKRKKLLLEGWISNPKAKIKVYYKNKLLYDLELNKNRSEISKYFQINNEKLGFSYELYIPIYYRNINVELVVDNDVIEKTGINNSVFVKIKNNLIKIFQLIKKTISVILKNPKILLSKKLLIKYKNVFFDKYYGRNVDNTINPFDKQDYIRWIIKNEKIDYNLEKFKYNPKISFIIPVYNPKLEDLKECIDSILNQTYKNFEICIVDDCSTKSEIIDYLKNLDNKYDFVKLKFHKKNEQISKTSNDCLKMTKGEFVALMDNDDTIAVNALQEAVKVLNNDKNTDFIYSDFDKLDKNNMRCDPYFKPDYSPDTLLSFNYLSHFNIIRKSIIDKVGGFDDKLIGAQDYDLYLKISELTTKIYHIPKILYHWRMAENSTASKKSKKNYAYDNGKIALVNAMKRRKINAVVETDKNSSFYKIRYLYEKEPKISIIIPTRDYSDILKKCINSIIKKTTYKNYEIIIIDNGSKENDTFKLFDYYTKNYDNIKIIKLDCEFNYSYLNNVAVKASAGDYVVLLNNDTELITPNWLEIMVGYAMQKHIGAVGVKLLYPDNTIQHGGVVLGLGGVASHSFIGEIRNYKAFNGLLDVPTNYSAVTAACLMIEKKKYQKVNGLDETLKVAYNDIDLNIKLLEKGFYNIFLPQVELYHYESKTRGLDTTGEKYERFLLESKIMYNKWNKYIKKDPFYNENYSLKSSFRLDK